MSDNPAKGIRQDFDSLFMRSGLDVFLRGHSETHAGLRPFGETLHAVTRKRIHLLVNGAWGCAGFHTGPRFLILFARRRSKTRSAGVAETEVSECS